MPCETDSVCVEDWLLQQMLDLMTELQRNQLRPPTPSADKREGGKNSRKGKAEKTEAEEPVLIQEFALLTGTLPALQISLDVQGVSKSFEGCQNL